jgi:pilus assembly protein Flp/PilA
VIHFAVQQSFYLSKELVMKTLTQSMLNFVRDEDGVTAIEYGLIASLIAVVIIATVTTVGTNLTSIFSYIASKLTVPST